MKSKKDNYWFCLIGPTKSKNLKMGADYPLRSAVQQAFEKTTGHVEDKCASGWGLDESRIDLLQVLLSMETKDPLYIAITAMLKGAGRL